MKNTTIILLVILFSISLIIANADEKINEPLTADEAKALLRQGFSLYEQDKYNDAILILEKVYKYDPNYEVDFSDEKINLRVRGLLARSYYGNQNWEKALILFEQHEKYLAIKKPNADTLIPTWISRCREKLAEEGKLESDPIAIISNRLMKKSSISENGSMLASTSEVAGLLNLDIKTDSAAKAVVLTSKNDSSKTIKMMASNKSAKTGSQLLLLSAPPVMKGSEMYIPLRSVAEYFGHQVKWESLPKVAWVF